MKYKIILYYKYVEVENPKQLLKDQRSLCESLGLKGRIIIAGEGINGTLEGKAGKVDEYVKALKADALFFDIDVKESEGNGMAFPKLSVKVRDEIVGSNLSDDINPAIDTGVHLESDLLHKWYENGEDFVVVDMRNDYEYVSGHFEKSINPQFSNFRDLPEKIEKAGVPRDKKVVTVCTGGVRCEKASAYLKKLGYKNVYQLKNGMHKYLEKYPDGYFKGALYVFDNRHTVRFHKDGEVVGKCEFCACPTEKYVDDDTSVPSRHILCCEKCFEEKVASGVTLRA
ncbi:MAG: rhodanese-related sulfurtransferase [bacterium]|nr:rhodanese-related sulfurtransferase [bacterium]